MGGQSLYRKRCKRWNIPWDAHYLTFSCYQRRAFLSKERPCRWLIEALQSARAKHPFDLWGFVVMPEHVHLLIWPHEGVWISPILKSIKLPVSQRAIRWLEENSPQGLSRLLDVQPNGRRAYRFWQRGGGYDRNMRTPRDVHEKLNYMHLNPVRRELAECAADWKWSSAKAWETGIDEPLKIDRESFPILER